MAKITLNDVSNITGNPTSAATTINANMDLIEAALEKTLSRDGTSPNTLGADLDVNSHRILNLPQATNDTDPIRKVDLEDLIDDIKVGPQGPAGAAGANGADGADGLGVPAGGGTGQVLTKASAADNDTEWADASGGGTTLNKDRYSPPAASHFGTITGTNSVTPTITDVSGCGTIFDFGASPAGGDNIRTAVKAKPTGTTTYSLIARIRPMVAVGGFCNLGLCLTDGTKIITWGVGDTASGVEPTRLVLNQWTDKTTFNSTRFSNNYGGTIPEWFRIDVISGVPTDFFFSNDGTNWLKAISESQGSFMTYTSIGVAIHIATQGTASGTSCALLPILYWSDPDITP